MATGHHLSLDPSTCAGVCSPVPRSFRLRRPHSKDTSRKQSMVSTSSGRSSTRSNACGGRGGDADRGTSWSPIAYREGPLEYEPAVYCKCKKKAPRWISRSIMNPGRRYYACINRRVGALPPVRELNLVFFRFNQNVECRSDYYRRADAISGSGMMKTALPHL